jgi:hypothetical protein
MTAAYVGQTQVAIKENLHKLPNFFIAPGNITPANSDLKTYYVGTFMYSAESTTVTDPIGEIWVEYDITFKTPQGDKPTATTPTNLLARFGTVLNVNTNQAVQSALGSAVGQVTGVFDAGDYISRIQNLTAFFTANGARQPMNFVQMAPRFNESYAVFRSVLAFAGSVSTGLLHLTTPSIVPNFGFLLCDSSGDPQTMVVPADTSAIDYGSNASGNGYNYTFQATVNPSVWPASWVYPLYYVPAFLAAPSVQVQLLTVACSLTYYPLTNLLAYQSIQQANYQDNADRGLLAGGVSIQLNSANVPVGDLFAEATPSGNQPSVNFVPTDDEFTFSELPPGVYYLLQTIEGPDLTGATTTCSVSSGTVSQLSKAVDATGVVMDLWTFFLDVTGSVTYSSIPTSDDDITDMSCTIWSVGPQ